MRLLLTLCFPRCYPRLLKPTAKKCKLQARLDFTDIVNLTIFKFWFLIFDFKMTAVIWLVFYFPTFRSGHSNLIYQIRDFFIDEKSSEDSDCLKDKHEILNTKHETNSNIQNSKS